MPTNRIRVLTLTRLFPSSQFPTLGIFCAERARALSRYADVRVMVPTPYYPRWVPAGGRWRAMARVEREGTTAEGVSVTYPRYVSVPKVATWYQGLAMARSARKEFARRYREWRPDIIDGHFAFPDGYAAVKLAESLGCASLVTCHGSDLRLYPSLVFTGSMMRQVMCRADRVISVGSTLRSRSIELGCPEENAVCLANGVDTDKFILRDRDQCRRDLGLPEDGRVVVCVGRLDDNKNQHVLICAMARMREQGTTPPCLALVGDGPNRLQLEREADRLGLTERVHFAGLRPHDEVPYWMAAADWLALASHQEGWATVYFEALACGRPVITSDVPSARDCVCDPRYGKVVEPNTPEAFAAAMIQAESCEYDPAVIRSYAEQHSWDKWARTMMDLVDQVRRSRN